MSEQKNTDRFNSLNGDQSFKTNRNYTHWQLLEKIDKYERLTKTKEDRDKLLEMKKEYLAREEKKPLIRAERDYNFNMGQRRGQSLDKNVHDLYEQDKLVDSRNREKLAKKVKIHYHKNFSISKNFKNKVQQKTKDKSIGKGYSYFFHVVER